MASGRMSLRRRPGGGGNNGVLNNIDRAAADVGEAGTKAPAPAASSSSSLSTSSSATTVSSLSSQSGISKAQAADPKLKSTINNIHDSIAESFMPDDERLIEKMRGNCSLVPQVLYASDGRKFYPCRYCCRAFAYKRNVVEHSNMCKYRIDSDEDESEEDVVGGEDESGGGDAAPQVAKADTVNGFAKAQELDKFKHLDDIKHLLENKEISIRPAPAKKPTSSPPPPRPQQQQQHHFTPANGGRNGDFRPPPHALAAPPLQPPRMKSAFVCQLCGRAYRTAQDLLGHKRHEHSYSKIKIPASQLRKYDEMFKANGGGDCPLCLKPILNKGGWVRHLHTHDADMKHFCKVCKKGFYRVDHKRDHERRHILLMERRNRGR